MAERPHGRSAWSGRTVSSIAFIISMAFTEYMTEMWLKR